jgi:FixJ family two-component response regulator
LIQVSARSNDFGSDLGFTAEARMPVPSTHRPPEQPGERICIVDDDDWVADSLKVLLQAFGFDVQSYSSGVDFLAADLRRHAACLIVDHHMPGMDGLAVVSYLQREGVRLPTILISGRLDTNLSERAAKLGVTKIIEKPFVADRIVDLIRTALSERNRCRS